MKKTLTLVLLTGLMLAGCSGKQSAGQPTGTATAVAVAAEAVTVPGVMNLTLDKATDQLQDLGFTVEAVDSIDGKSILVRKNWQVTSQDAAAGAHVPKGSTVHLDVKSLDKVAAEKAAADKATADRIAADKVAADKVAADKASADKAAADKAAADKAAADKAAADRAAADKAAADKAAAAQQQAAQQAPQQAPAIKAPTAVYYQNCDAVKAAGAAPLYANQPGFRAALDRNNNGVACE